MAPRLGEPTLNHQKHVLLGHDYLPLIIGSVLKTPINQRLLIPFGVILL